MINKGSSLRVSLIFELGRMSDLVGLSDIRGHGDGDGVTFFAVIPECFTDTQIMWFFFFLNTLVYVSVRKYAKHNKNKIIMISKYF